MSASSFSLGTEVSVISPQSLSSQGPGVVAVPITGSHLPGSISGIVDLGPSSQSGSVVWPILPSVVTTNNTAAPLASSISNTVSSMPSTTTPKTPPVKNALVVAIQEQLSDLATQLTSPEPDVKQLHVLCDVLSDALQRQNDSENSSLMASNLAAAAAAHYVRLASSIGTPNASTSMGVGVGSGGREHTIHVVEQMTPVATPKAAKIKTPMIIPPAAMDVVDDTMAMQWQARIPRDPALVEISTDEGVRWCYRCKRCLSTFPWRRQLERHFDTHRTVDKTCICHACGKAFSRADHLNRHALNHQLPEFVCQLCGLVFTRASHLDRHWRNLHMSGSSNGISMASPLPETSATKPPKPLENAAALPSPTSRIVHAEQPLVPLNPLSPPVGVSNNDQEAKITAEQLHELKSKAAALEKAMHLASPSPVPVYLLPTGKTDELNTSGSASMTDSRVHSTIGVAKKPRLRGHSAHPCPDCLRVFTRVDHMRRHQRIHSGERPYTCSLCGKSFSRGDYLREHLIAQHNSTPMRCRVCQNIFSTVSSLRMHQCRTGRARTWYLQSCFVDANGDALEVHPKAHSAAIVMDSVTAENGEMVLESMEDDHEDDDLNCEDVEEEEQSPEDADHDDSVIVNVVLDPEAIQLQVDSHSLPATL